MPAPTPLSLEGLAAILERHIQHTAQGFQRVEGQIGALANRLDDLTGQVEALVGLVREQGLRLTALAEQQAEQQVQIRQVLHRLEQHDARFEEHSRRLDEHSRRLDEHGVYIRRMLDLLERRGGDGGPASR
jgi:chromosome segregation ATPase